MRRLSIVVVLITSLLMLSAPAIAAAAPRDGESGVIPLGIAIHGGRLVEGYAFVHGRNAEAKPGAPGKPSKTDPLYTFLARGVAWRTSEPFVVNAANGHNVAAEAVLTAVEAAGATWEAQTTKDIFAEGSLTGALLVADRKGPDDVNEVYFSHTELGPGTVAVTVVWWIAAGPASTREIVEWDLVLNDALLEPWGDATASPGALIWDVQNIATHELGHAAGLGDLYQTAAMQQTMYGRAAPGETDKRTLESGDIAGIKALYP